MDDVTPDEAVTTEALKDLHVASVTIRAFGSDGEGVGDLPDGRVVFVPRTAPGDEVSLRLTRQKKRWARGQLVEVLQAGPNRAEPVCPYYASCGGCALQHVSYEEQLAWKGRFVEEALKRIGGLEVTVPPVVPSPDRHNYRSRITFTLLRIPGERVVAGFHHLLHSSTSKMAACSRIRPSQRRGSSFVRPGVTLRGGFRVVNVCV